MSYGIMAYLVPTASIESLVGSKDEALKNKIIQENKRDVDDLDGFLWDLWEEEEITVANILDHFVQGAVPASGAGAAYGYVFKMLCEHYGTFLDNGEWYPCSWEDMEVFDSAATYGLPISFPSPDDFPMIKYISNAKAGEALESLTPQNSMERQYALWLQQAKASGKDIFLFYH